MSTSAKIGIKELPETQTIANGDKLVVSTSGGTYLLDYENLILDPENTAITSVVLQNTSSIATLSSSVDSKFESMSAQVYSDFQRVYVGKATVTINNGTTNSAFLSPRPPADMGEITPDDVIITPANTDACKYPAVLTYIDNTDDAKGYFTIGVPFKRTVYSMAGAFYSRLQFNSNPIMSDTDKLSGYTFADLMNNVLGFADPYINQTTPITISSVEESTTADVLEVSPQYYVQVVKPY